MAEVRAERRATAGRVRARAVGGPMVPRVPGRTGAAGMSAAELLAEVARRDQAAGAQLHALGVCLAELAKRERYHGELGYASFKELLEAHRAGARGGRRSVMRCSGMRGCRARGWMFGAC